MWLNVHVWVEPCFDNVDENEDDDDDDGDDGDDDGDDDGGDVYDAAGEKTATVILSQPGSWQLWCWKHWVLVVHGTRPW